MTLEEITKVIKDKFKKLNFDPIEHKYTVEGKSFVSVSGLIKNFVTPFDSLTIAGFVAKSRNITTEEVLQEWEDIKNVACDFGHRVHDFGERYAADKFDVETELVFSNPFEHINSNEELSGQEEALMKFWEEKPDYIVPILLELRMYSDYWDYAGTADLIFIDTRDMTIVIGDYKTNKDLFKQHKDQKLLGIFNSMSDTPFSKYEIQLSFYKILIELTGFKVSRTFLVWLKDDGEYTIYNTEDKTKELFVFLEQRKIDQLWH